MTVHDAVRLSLTPSGDLHLEVLSAIGEHTPYTLSAGDKQVACIKGALEIRAGGHWVGGVNQLAFALGRRSLALELHAAPGVLIVKRKERTRGVINAFPVRFASDEWHRFERLE
jgi:hypothetical protein